MVDHQCLLSNNRLEPSTVNPLVTINVMKLDAREEEVKKQVMSDDDEQIALKICFNPQKSLSPSKKKVVGNGIMKNRK